ncbi:hypothetical protein, partial [Streptomyces decoyicus]|uniref:hypothetical protein n=1 Tax=Streptomyces decoyicus TaxID=249567 RepID=UPI0033B67B07
GHIISREGPVLSTAERAQLIRRVVDEALGLGAVRTPTRSGPSPHPTAPRSGPSPPQAQRRETTTAGKPKTWEEKQSAAARPAARRNGETRYGGKAKNVGRKPSAQTRVS